MYLIYTLYAENLLIMFINYAFTYISASKSFYGLADQNQNYHNISIMTSGTGLCSEDPS